MDRIIPSRGDEDGQMGALLRAHDWSTSPLGPTSGWPQSLMTATSLVVNSAQPMFIAWGPELCFIYNDAYAEILGSKHPAALGRPFGEIWAEIWADVGPLAERALAGERVWLEDLPLVMNRHGYDEETWFTFSYSPVRGEGGEIGGMFCACSETTRRVLAERAHAAGQQALLQERDRLYGLFEEAPGLVAVVRGPDNVFALANKAYRDLVGDRELIGRPAREAMPELEGQGLFELIDKVYATGEPYVGVAVPGRLRRAPDGAPEERFFDFVYQPIREADGTISGIFHQGFDVTERVVFMSQQKLLLDELNHRVKNNLATVQSIAYQTARHAPDLETFRRTFESRLIALSRTHDVLTANAWESAELRTLLHSELGHYGENRVRLEGPAVRLSAPQTLALGLVIHELATNAAKYGALGPEDGGCVRVTWTKMEGGDGGHMLDLAWRESDGPQVTTPQARGFGSRLIARGVQELGGTVTKDWLAHGLQCRITIPLGAASTDRTVGREQRPN